MTCTVSVLVYISHSTCVGCDHAVIILFVFVYFIVCLTFKCGARCCYDSESRFNNFFSPNNPPRIFSVIWLGCFVAWSDLKYAGRSSSILFGILACV